MTFKTVCLIAGIVSLILIVEIIFACVNCSKLCKYRSKRKEDQAKHKTNLHSFLLLSAAALYPIPIVLIFVLGAEVIYFAWLNVSLVKMLDEEKKEEDIELAATMVRHSISLEEAHDALSDEAALHLIEEEEEPEEEVVVAAAGTHRHLWIHRRYKNKTIINVDTLSQKFSDNDHVNLHTLKEKKLIHANVDYVKVLGRGTLDKCLFVEAHAFSADAVKMIVLTGGHAIKFVHDKHHHTHHKS